jgi:hypothetical protein
MRRTNIVVAFGIAAICYIAPALGIFTMWFGKNPQLAELFLPLIFLLMSEVPISLALSLGLVAIGIRLKSWTLAVFAVIPTVGNLICVLEFYRSICDAVH